MKKAKRIIIFDIAENGAYEIQQELKMIYGSDLQIQIEIVSVCNKAGLERVFSEHKPQIVLNAAAHKHVPLMEKNCVEAVENNVFGTLNTVELSEKYGVERLIMVSADKAVNPTNVMGATKRVCEMIGQAYSQKESADPAGAQAAELPQGAGKGRSVCGRRHQAFGGGSEILPRSGNGDSVRRC